MSQNQTETRFIELMTELFQLDEAEALDFGLYRIIRRQNREIRAFIGEVVTEHGQKTLQGGRLSALLAETFASADHESTAEDKYRIAELEKDLGIKPVMNLPEREALLASLEKIPATAQMVADYRSRLENRAAAKTATTDQAEVLNRLYQFFSRHYQDGDFIVERRYGRDGSRYIRSTGEDTEFHWATEDMYYIKSGDIFTDFPVKLVRGQRLLFTVEAESLQKTRAELKPSDKAHYELAAVTPGADGIFKVSLKYLKGAQSDKQKDEIALAAQKASGGDAVEIKRWLNHFIARNQSDFFIHKRLKEALLEDLDIFIKTEVLDADQLLADGDLPRRVTKVARIVRRVGQQIIDFLAVLEDFQKALWEKKKLVFATRYVITLDRIDKLAGRAWLEAQLERIVELQREEWRALGLGDIATPAACRVEIPGDLLTPSRLRYLPLPVDTVHFDDEFKWALLAAVTREEGLDAALDGVAIHSDNWQALNTLASKYREQVKCIYIDPPYNTGGDGFPYKDSYQSASWLAMLHDRLGLAAQTLQANGVLFSSIDQNEYPKLRTLLEGEFGRGNALGTIVWKNVTDNNPTNIAIEHEYIECFAKNRALLESEWKNPYSDAKDLLVKLALELIEKHGDTKALRVAYQEWLRDNKAFLGPLEGYKFIDGGGIYAGSRSVHNPGKEGYRYDIPHDKTGKPCKQPLMGYRFPEDTSKKLIAEGRIIFGEDENKIIELKVYAHEYEAKLPSVIEIDGRSGANDLANLFGESQLFKNPKASALLQEIIPYAAGKGDVVMDFFAGSGTTEHAVMRLNKKAALGLRWVCVEAGHNFDALILPRLKKAGFSVDWLKGRPISNDGPGLFMRVQALEQYEDTLENLDTESPSDSLELPFDDPAWRLRYRLEQASRALYCGIDRFASPFGYTLKRVEGGGDAPERPVDLVESLVYLLGLEVSRLLREAHGVVVTGRDRRQQSVAVFFRDCAAVDSADWLKGKLLEYPADRVLTNDPASLTFEGCERFEAIETVFAGQFGRV